MNFKEGNIQKSILKFTFPLLITLIAQQLYNIVDTMIVGRFLGLDALAAVGNAGSMIFILVVISSGLEMGCEIIFAKFAGEWKSKDFSQTATSILIFGLCSAIFLSIAGLLLKHQLMNAINIPATIRPMLISYYNIYVGCIFCTFIYDISRAILLAMGNSKTCMYLILFSTITNIGLDLFFICVLHMGVAGAALATVFAQFLGLTIALYLLICKSGYHKFNLTKNIFLAKIKEVLKIAVPSMMQQFALSLTSLLLLSIVNPFGTQIISGYIAAEKIISFALIPVVGFSMSTSIFTSANENNLNRIHAGFRFLLLLALLYTSGIAIVIALFPKAIISPFIDTANNPQAFSYTSTYLKYSIFTLYAAALKFMNDGLLRGYARMKSFLFASITDMSVKVIFAYTLISLLTINTFYLANFAGKFSALLVSTFLLWRFYKQNP